MGLEGGCSCGAVRYETEAVPFHRTLCHCIDCRRAAGAPAVHRSSPQVERSFCAACGTPLSYRNDGYAHEIDVLTCTLDDPEAASPQDHTFASQRLGWLRVDDGMPVYPRSRGEGLQEDQKE